jgi:nucleoid DNA-binding protein
LLTFVKTHFVLKISDYIAELLLFLEKVVLPGFGTFEIQRKPAIIEDNKVIPPGITIRFNAEDTLDDNMLSSKVAEAEELELDEARQRVLEFIDEIKFALNKGEKYSMPGFGELFLDENNNYKFVKDPGFRIDFEGSGFEAFELDSSDLEAVKLEQTESSENVKASFTDERPLPITDDPYLIEEPRVNDHPETHKTNRNFLWILSGSVVVILLSFGILFLSTDIFTNFDYSFLKVWDKQESSTPRLILGDDEAFDKEFEAAIDSLAKIENDLEPEKEEILIPSVYAEYYIIAGSFSLMKNAEDLQKDLALSGYQSLIIDRGDGFYRVSAISFHNKEEALIALEEFKGSTPYKTAWLMGIN